MRKAQEINKAIALLRKREDGMSLIQIEVLENKHSEVWVFERYVRDVADKDRNEAAYCAAREAALFLNGKIELSELIPGLEYELTAEDEVEAEETITISKSEFAKLLKRIERLERRMGLKKEVSVTKRKSVKEAPDDLIPQVEACKYVGCGKTTIKRWADNGFITGYLKGPHVFYSKRELDRSAVVKEHRLSKKGE